MDRAYITKKNLLALGLLMTLFMSLGDGKADIVLTSPPPPPAPPRAGENFAESRFGSPPINPDLEVASNVPKRMMEEMQDIDSDEESVSHSSPGRGLASEKPSRSLSQSNPVPGTAITRNGVQEVALIASDLGFFPKTVFVTRDIPVRMYVTGASKKPLCIMLDFFQVRKQVRSQKIEEISFVPSVPGKYRFYCPVNGMEGTLLIKELSSNTKE